MKSLTCVLICLFLLKLSIVQNVILFQRMKMAAFAR